MRLFGFDSFEGLPDAAGEAESGQNWSPGQYAIGESFTRRFLTRAGIDWLRVKLIEGWFSDTLTPELEAESFGSYVHTEMGADAPEGEIIRVVRTNPTPVPAPG